VVTVVPANSLPKLWASELDADPDLRRMNPMAVYSGADREYVKKMTTAAVDELTTVGSTAGAFRVWYTLNPNNYRLADLVRALFEYDFFPPRTERWHAHAVSSAYGFLGHDLGRRLSAEAGVVHEVPQKYLLVQHLETPDLVSAVTGADIESVAQKIYEPGANGRLVRPLDADPRLPESCYSVDERLERTFYTRRPPTTDAVRDLLTRRGGDAMVVSLAECFDRYPFVRTLLQGGGFDRLPQDPRWLREWAMVMAMVGCLNAIDRGLIPAGVDVVVHGSGAYSEGEFEQIDRGKLIDVNSSDDVGRVIVGAVSAQPRTAR
jgi:hypothetical protein